MFHKLLIGDREKGGVGLLRCHGNGTCALRKDVYLNARELRHVISSSLEDRGSALVVKSFRFSACLVILIYRPSEAIARIFLLFNAQP